jgi:hypothetical protein
MISSPANHALPPCRMIRASSPRGRNLAGITHAGHFLFSSPALLRGKGGRQTHNRLLAFAARLSIVFSQPAHKFSAHNTDRDHAAPVRLGEGAAGLVLRNAQPRPSILSETNHVTHETHSVGSSSRKREPNKEQFSWVQNLVAR